MLYVSFAGRDKMFLVLQSKNLLEGKGLSIPRYFINNIENPVYDFTPLWPPGYPVLLAPFLKLFNYDVYWATTTLDIITCIAFIFILRKLCLQLNFPVAAANLVTLVAGCFEYPFIYESLPTDTVSLTFFLLGLIFVLKSAYSESLSPFVLFLAAFFLFLPCTFRYAYPPLSLAVPIAIVLLGFLKKNKLLVKKGVFILSITLFFIAAFSIYLKSSTGSAGYITETQRGIFPGNLVHWHSFFIAAFINLPFLTSQVIKITGLGLPQVMIFLEILNAVLVIAVICFFLFPILKKMRSARPAPFETFLVMGIFISVALLLSLGYLSLTYQIQSRFIHSWNYIGEPRYYGFIHVFLQIAFIGVLFLYPAWKKNWLQKSILVACSVVLFIEIAHNIYFNTKVATNFRAYKSAHYKELDYAYFTTLIDSVIKKNTGTEILAMSDNDHFVPFMAAFHNKKGVFDAINLNKGLPRVKTKTILLLVLYDDEIPVYQEFLSHNNVKFLNRVLSSNYYLLELNP